MSGRRITSANYQKFRKSLVQFLTDGDSIKTLYMPDITDEFVSSYERHLVGRNLNSSTVSFYNRIFRSIYNQAVKEGLVKNAHPFDSAYTKVIPPKRVQMVDVNGEMVDMSTLTKDEVIARYCILADKHNRLIKSITEMVHVS